MISKIGAITIGQSPRDDIIPDLKKLIGIEIPIEVFGILDNLKAKEIKKMAPGKKEDVLMTRLADGTSVALGYESVVRGIQKCLTELRTKEFEIIALLCTCHFSELKNEKGLVQVSNLMEEKVRETIEKDRLGILIPSAKQILQTEKKWRCPGIQVLVASASPYGKKEEVISAVKSLVERRVDLIVLDCIGYNLSLYERLKKAFSIPMILPLELLAQGLNILIE
jgi:protein AroM